MLSFQPDRDENQDESALFERLSEAPAHSNHGQLPMALLTAPETPAPGLATEPIPDLMAAMTALATGSFVQRYDKSQSLLSFDAQAARVSAQIDALELQLQLQGETSDASISVALRTRLVDLQQQAELRRSLSKESLEEPFSNSHAATVLSPSFTTSHYLAALEARATGLEALLSRLSTRGSCQTLDQQSGPISSDLTVLDTRLGHIEAVLDALSPTMNRCFALAAWSNDPADLVSTLTEIERQQIDVMRTVAALEESVSRLEHKITS